MIAIRNILLIATLGFVVSFTTYDAHASVFLSIPSIPGDSTALGFTNDIELNSFQFSNARAITLSFGSTEQQASAPTISDLVITKTMDKSSPGIVEAFFLNHGISKIDIFLTKPSAFSKEQFVYAHYTLSNVLFSSYSISSGGDAPTESIGINFEKLQTTATTQNPDGSVGQTISFCWNESTNQECSTSPDTTPPIVRGSITPSPNAKGWNNSTVAITWSGTDTESGIKSCDDPTVYSGPDTSGINETGHCTDNAGNIGAGNVTIHYDATKPIITGAPTTAPNANGWYDNNVTVNYTATDATSGIATITPNVMISTEGKNQNATGIAIDNAGNVANFTVSGINIDKTPPVITVPPDVTQEATGQQTIVSLGTVTANDAVDGSVTVTNNATIIYPVGITKIQYTATDLAGNTAIAYQTVTITDTTPPTLTLPTQVIAQATGPSGAAVTYTASATDLVDGSVTAVCTPPSGNTFAFGTTKVTCTATDAHNNQATGTFNVIIQNNIPPTLLISSPANNAIVNTATVPVSGTASDIVSLSKITWKVDNTPVSTATGTTSWHFTTNTLSLGTHTIQVNATDSAGLVTISTVIVTYAAPTDSIPSSSGTGQITFTSNKGGFTSLNSIPRSSLPTPPPPGIYPLGFFSWGITGFAPATSVTVAVTSPTTLHNQSHYFKLIGGTWISIPVTVHGNTMTFTISDNGPLDGNPTAGIISDPASVADPTNGRVTGGGNIGKGTNFGFDVTSDIDKTNFIKGNLEYQDRYVKLNLHSNDVSFLSVDSTTSQATIVGTTDYDRHDKHSNRGTNYTFLVTISDPDKTGEHDTFSITVTDNTGKVVYQNSGIVKGHIEIHKFTDHDDKSDSGIQHGNNSNNVNRNNSH